MKYLIIILLLATGLDSIYASPQDPECFIVNKDTFYINNLPLNQLDTIRYKELKRNIKAYQKNNLSSLYLYRGYQGYWRLENNKLYLTGLLHNENSDKILAETFKDRYIDGKVWADWCTIDIALKNDREIRRYDYSNKRIYLREKLLVIKKGILAKSKIVNNYKDLKHGISRLQSDEQQLLDTINQRFMRLDWARMYKDFGAIGDKRFLITINRKGHIQDVDYVTSIKDPAKKAKYKAGLHLIKQQLKSLQFDIIKLHGKPIEDTFIFNVDYLPSTNEFINKNEAPIMYLIMSDPKK